MKWGLVIDESAAADNYVRLTDLAATFRVIARASAAPVTVPADPFKGPPRCGSFKLGRVHQVQHIRESVLSKEQSLEETVGVR